MKINWFTVIAQVINFLILVWLLKRFLYKPVLDAIDKREKKITSRLEDAKKLQAEAKKEQDEFTQKNEAFDKEKLAMMDKAIADTEVQKNRLMEEARNLADALRSKQQKAMDDMQDDLKTALAQKAQQEVFDISKKVLADLASVHLEEQVVKLFISRLKELDAGGRKQFQEAFKAGTNPVLIQSAFELHKKQQTEIEKAVDEILGKETIFQYKTVPKIISGIELTSNGYKLAWSISAYLDSFEKSISETLKEKKTEEPGIKVAVAQKEEQESKKQTEMKTEPENAIAPEKK